MNGVKLLSSISACALVLSSSALLGRTITGTVYSDHSGDSGRGTGVLELATQTGLVRLHYQKPFRQRFSNTKCLELGAIWTAQTDEKYRSRPGEEEMVQARCDGKVDAAINSAWTAVLSYLKKVVADSGHTLGFQIGRDGPIYVDMGGLGVEISGYVNFPGRGMCLEMGERLNSTSIVIKSSADCFFDPDIDFTTERITQTEWRVARVTAAEPAPRNAR